MTKEAVCQVCGGLGQVYVGQGFDPCWNCNATGVIQQEEKDDGHRHPLEDD